MVPLLLRKNLDPPLRGYQGIEGVTGDYRNNYYSLLQQHEQQIYLTALVRGLQGVIGVTGVIMSLKELQGVAGSYRG